MVILGIDPGSRHTGFGVVRKRGERLEVVRHGRFSYAGGLPLPERLHRLSRDLDRLVASTEPDAVALETAFHGINSRSLIVLAQARGALLATLAARGVEILEFTPAEVKSAVSGNGRADKRQVAKMVRLILALRERTSADATDALAVAVCCAQRYRFEHLAGRV